MNRLVAFAAALGLDYDDSLRRLYFPSQPPLQPRPLLRAVNTITRRIWRPRDTR